MKCVAYDGQKFIKFIPTGEKRR